MNKTLYQTDKSRSLFERSLRVLVEGGSSPSRGPANYGDYPLFIARGQGSSIFDVDGNRYIDWMMAYGALPLGHAHPEVVEAIQQTAASGTLFAAATELEVELAEAICQMVPNLEKVRFANTGTEAAMAAIRLARGCTGRQKFIKFEGHYHGWYDDFLLNAHPQPLISLGYANDPVRIPDSSGLNRRALEDTIVVPWNDPTAVERALASNRGQIAAIITEGIMANMGVILPRPGYLSRLQELARAEGALFILDETVTGFRVAPGGCQELYGLEPDLVVFGKALGAGLPVAAFGGKADIMQALAWGGVLHYGTQNASRLGLAASLASLRVLARDDGAAFNHCRELGDQLCRGLRAVFSRTGTTAIVQNQGPMLQIMFTDRPEIGDYREFCEAVDRQAYQRFAWSLFPQGVYMSPSAALHSVVSLAHSTEDVQTTIRAAEKALADA